MLRYFGLKRRTDPGVFVVSLLGVIAGGLVVGAGVALLFAPSTGKELRTNLTKKVKRARDEILPRSLTSNAITAH